MKINNRFGIASILSVSLLIFIVSVYSACNQDKNTNATGNPSEPAEFEFLSDEIFVGENTCRECHAEQFEAWQGSHHDLAMQEANESTVLGDFADKTYTTPEGMKTRFYRVGDEFWVNTEGGDGEYHDCKILYTFGVTPLQQYIIEFPKGKYQCLSTAWDSVEKKWFDLYPGLHVIHSEWLHQSKGALNWNTMCADCHSTNVRKNFIERADSFHTQYSIINVSCEACHGPGKRHVENARKGEGSYAYSEDEQLMLTTNISPKVQVDQCARCHARREQMTLSYNFNGTFVDHYFPQLLTQGMYHADGQILDEVYVYGSFIQSKMYMNNVKCTDCHDAHSMELKFIGNKLCQQCHVPEKFDTPQHTFHQPDTEGSQCVNCHMTGNTYMVNDYRRDHSFRIPRPDLSIKYQTPNACIQCHTDQTNEWAWENYKKWYGTRDSIHHTDILAEGREGHASSIHNLLQLSSDSHSPPIVRATAIHYLGNMGNEQASMSIVKYLKDEEPLVRGATLDALNPYQVPAQFLNDIYPLLSDEKRSIRIKAFNSLVGLPLNQIPQQYHSDYKMAKVEFLDYLEATADFSGGQANKALYYERIGDVDNAIRAYSKALEIDDHNNRVRNNLANLYYQKGELDKAEKAFRKIIEQEPEYGYTYYSLGLLLAEKGKYSQAIPVLETGIEKMPENMRAYYNLGLIYQNTGELDKAEKIFLNGLKKDPQNESILYALVFYYGNQLKDMSQAKYYAQQLVEYYPNNQEYRQMLQNLSQSLPQ